MSLLALRQLSNQGQSPGVTFTDSQTKEIHYPFSKLCINLHLSMPSPMMPPECPMSSLIKNQNNPTPKSAGILRGMTTRFGSNLRLLLLRIMLKNDVNRTHRRKQEGTTLLLDLTAPILGDQYSKSMHSLQKTNFLLDFPRLIFGTFTSPIIHGLC